MAGFTPINAPPAPIRQQHRSDNSENTQRQTRSTGDIANGKASKTSASDYLGRGDPTGVSAEIKEGSGALNGSGTKKPRGAGQKRSSNTGGQKSAKRQKTNDGASGMSITKPAAKAKKKTAVNSPSSTIVDGGKVPDLDTSNASNIVATEYQPQMVSVIAPTTSMNSLHSSAQPTSLDAVRSSGHSTVVYQGANNKAEKPTARLQKPHTSLQQVREQDKESYSRALQPRNPNVVPNDTITSAKKARQVDDSVDPSEIRLIEQKKQHSSTSRSTKSDRTRHGKSTGTSKTISEDFIGEDDEQGLIEALNEAVVIAADPEVTRKRGAPLEGAPQLLAPKLDERMPSSFKNSRKNKRKETPILGPEEEFMQLCDKDEAGIVELADSVEEHTFDLSPMPQHRNKKLNLREVDPHEDYGGALLSDTDKQLLAELKSSQTTDNPVILRKPFPAPILDRSPIFGTTNTTVLRTCFRLGEALNVGSNAVRTNSNVILELYARVFSSYREARKQHFVFRDLYHDHPPHLEGTFGLWQQSPLWDLDGRAFLSACYNSGGAMCRLIGRMKKEVEAGGMGKVKYRLEVLSIWEAGWEDIDYVAGIYAKE